MTRVYVLRQSGRDEFRIVQSKETLARLIEGFSEKIADKMEEFATLETADSVACETFLHQTLRPMRRLDLNGLDFYQVAAAEMHAAIEGARQFVSDFVAASKAAEQLGKREPEPGSPAIRPSAADLAIYARLLRVRVAQDHLKVQRDYCESKLKLSIGNASVLAGIATWKGIWRSALDVQALRAGEPAIFETLNRRFEKKTYSRYFTLRRPD